VLNIIDGAPHTGAKDTYHDPCLQRFCEAYLAMARKANYRPAAPGDGCGHVFLNPTRARLDAEATAYAIQFLAEEDRRSFRLGCSDFSTNKAFCWAIEAARQLASGVEGRATACKLLRVALTEIARVQRGEAQ
jgi:hypothetical protein